MRHLRSRTGLVRWIAVMLVTAFLQGCMHWSAMPLGPQSLPDRMRVTLDSGEHLVLTNPAIVGDSLVGYSSPEIVRRSISLAHVKLAEVETPDDAATAGLVIGALVAVLVIGYVELSTCTDCFGGF